MEKKVIDATLINGWAIDNNPLDEPNYPIKKYTGDDHRRKNWTRPALQATDKEILKSTERPFLSAVFGTKHSPVALSGALRRFAFKCSENMYRHWLPLLLADRIDVVESIVSDIFHGRIPRLAKERGWGAIAKYRPMLLVRKIFVRLLVVAIVVVLTLYFRDHEFYKHH
jgi:hypothetical protein